MRRLRPPVTLLPEQLPFKDDEWMGEVFQGMCGFSVDAGDEGYEPTGGASAMTSIKILTMPGCAHCPEAKALAFKMKEEMPELEVEVIDVLEHPEVATKYQLMSAPGIVINDKLEWVGGVPKEEELRAKLKG